LTDEDTAFVVLFSLTALLEPFKFSNMEDVDNALAEAFRELIKLLVLLTPSMLLWLALTI